MRFFGSIFVTLLAASGFIGSGLAAPTVQKRSLDVSSALTIVDAVTQQIQGTWGEVNQTLAGITSSSSPDVKAAAAQKVAQQLAAIPQAFGQAIANVTQQAGGGSATRRTVVVRQNGGDTGDLITAITNLATMIDSLLIDIITVLNVPGLLGPATEILSTLTSFILAVVAVVVDILPFLGDIGMLLSGIGSILGGIGGLIPKGA